jgi:hypothetical protein
VDAYFERQYKSKSVLMQRRQFLNRSALWGGSFLLAGGWISRLWDNQATVFGTEFKRFSPAQQDVLHHYRRHISVSLQEHAQRDKWVEIMLRPVEVVRQDVAKDILIYRNASGQFVLLDQHKEDYRLRFLDALPKDMT